MNYASVVQRLFGRVPTNLSLVSIVEAGTPEAAAIEESRRHLADFSDAPHAVARVGDRFVAVGRTHAVMLNSTSTDIARIPEEEQEKDPPATVRELTPVEKKNAREHVKRGRKEFRFGRFKPGMAVTWNGERWIVYDARARGGSRFTLMLVSPDYEKLADEVQPADLGETESTVIEAGNLPASFTPAHLDQLRKQFASVERIDPSGPSYDKMLKLLDGMSQQQLKQVAGAGIKFLSKLALNRVKRTEAVGEARVRRVLWSTKVGNDTWGAAVLGPHFFATLNGEDYDFEDGEVYGLVAPKKVPPAVAARLEKSRLDFEGDKQTARESVQEARFQHGDRVRIHYKNPRTDIEKAFQGKVGSISGEERDGSTRMFRVKFNPPVQVPGVDPVTSDLWTAEFLKPAGAAETVMVRHGTLAAFVAANAPRLASLPGEGTAFQKLWLGEFGALSESTGMSRWTHFGQQLSESFQAFDRYDALGIPRPDPATMCKGPCEGTGVVPISRDETDPELRRRWDVAEQENPADDGWHFVVCPACEGSRLSEEGAWRTTKSGHRIFIDGGKVTKGNPHVLKAAGGQDSSAGASGETDQAKSHASKHGLKMVAAPKGKAAVGSKLPYASDGTIVAGYAVNAKGQRFALTQGPDGKIGMLTAGKHKESVDEAEPGDGMRFGAAKLVGGEKAVPFSALKVGAKFHFPKSSTTYTKTSEAGKYAAADGRKFKTGTHAAVIPESLDEGRGAPSWRTLADELIELSGEIDAETEVSLEVWRGNWNLQLGPGKPTPSRRASWASATIDPGLTMDDAKEVALDMLDQIKGDRQHDESVDERVSGANLAGWRVVTSSTGATVRSKDSRTFHIVIDKDGELQATDGAGNEVPVSGLPGYVIRAVEKMLGAEVSEARKAKHEYGVGDRVEVRGEGTGEIVRLRHDSSNAYEVRFDRGGTKVVWDNPEGAAAVGFRKITRAEGLDESMPKMAPGQIWTLSTSGPAEDPDFWLFVTHVQKNGAPEGVQYDVRRKKAILASFNGYNGKFARQDSDAFREMTGDYDPESALRVTNTLARHGVLKLFPGVAESVDEAQLPKSPHKGKPWDDVVAVGKGHYIVKIWRGQRTKWAYSTTNPQGGGFSTTVETQDVMAVLAKALNINDKPKRVWVVVGARKPTDPFDPFEVATAFWFDTEKNLPESVDEAKAVPPIDSPTYREVAKLPKYNAKVSPLSAHGSDGGKLLAKRLPGWTKADHLAAASEHEKKADEMSKQHSALLNTAAQAVWGRDFKVTDYRISGIGSDEFSQEHKDELRRLAHTSSAHKDAAHAHRAAAKMRSLAKEDLDEAKVVWSAAVPAKAQKKGYVPDPTLGQAGMNERCRHCYYAESVDGPDGKQVRCLMFRFLAASAGHCDEWERRGSPHAKKVSIPREGVDEGYQHVHFEGSKSARAKVVMFGGKTKSVQGRTFDGMLLVHPTGNYQWGVTHIPTGLGLVPPPGFADDRDAVRFAKAASALGGWDFTDPTAVPPELSQKMGTLVASFRSSIRRTGGGSYESVDDLDEARAFKLSTKDPATMTPAEINREKDKLSAASSALTDKFIEMGRGHWKQSDIRAEAEKGDELSKQSVAISDRQQDLSIEIELRYGPNAPTRLPLRKGFGPRKKTTDESVDESQAKQKHSRMMRGEVVVVSDDDLAELEDLPNWENLASKPNPKQVGSKDRYVAWFKNKQADESVDEMAKLSAKGAKELMRASKESVVTDDESIDWRRVTRAWMDDGRVLEKRDVNFKATGAADYQKARKHSYGWKVLGRFKPGLLKDNEKLAAAMTKTRANLEAEGWSIESFTTPQ
jgi:hypothetical protein